MIQRISKIVAGLVLVVTVATPLVAKSPTHTISADIIDAFTEFEYAGDPLVPVGMFPWARGRVQGVGDAEMELVTNNPSVGRYGGEFTGTFQVQRFGGYGGPKKGNSVEYLYGVVSAGNGNAYGNGYQVNYFATVTVTGGTGRYSGAAGTINLRVYQNGILDPAEHPDNFGFRIHSEFILDGQYSAP